jgi:hypothetical protein
MSCSAGFQIIYILPLGISAVPRDFALYIFRFHPVVLADQRVFLLLHAVQPGGYGSNRPSRMSHRTSNAVLLIPSVSRISRF